MKDGGNDAATINIQQASILAELDLDGGCTSSQHIFYHCHTAIVVVHPKICSLFEFSILPPTDGFSFVCSNVASSPRAEGRKRRRK